MCRNAKQEGAPIQLSSFKTFPGIINLCREFPLPAVAAQSDQSQKVSCQLIYCSSRKSANYCVNGQTFPQVYSSIYLSYEKESKYFRNSLSLYIYMYLFIRHQCSKLKSCSWLIHCSSTRVRSTKGSIKEAQSRLRQ